MHLRMVFLFLHLRGLAQENPICNSNKCGALFSSICMCFLPGVFFDVPFHLHTQLHVRGEANLSAQRSVLRATVYCTPFTPFCIQRDVHGVRRESTFSVPDARGLVYNRFIHKLLPACCGPFQSKIYFQRILASGHALFAPFRAVSRWKLSPPFSRAT